MPSLIATLGINTAGFRSGLNSAVTQANTAGAKIGTALGSALSSRLAGFVGIGSLTLLTKSVVEYGSKISDLSARLNIGTEALQAWDYALKQTGSSIEVGAKFFEQLAKARDYALAGQAVYTRAFEKFGVTIDELKSKRLEDLGLQLAKTFKAGNAQEMIGALKDIGGRGGTEMATAFREGLAELIEEAKGAGVIMSDEMIGRLDELADKFSRLWMQVKAAAAPVLGFIVDGFQAIADEAARAGALAGGFWEGGFSGAKEAWKRVDDEIIARERKAIERRQRLNKQGGAGGVAPPDEKAVKAAEKEREKLAEKLAALQDKNYLDALTKEEKITELHRRRVQLAELLAANWNKLSEGGRLKAQIDLESLLGQEAALSRNADKKQTRTEVSFDRTAAQRIGAFSLETPYQAATLDVERKSEQHLRVIRDHVERQTESPVTF